MKTKIIMAAAVATLMGGLTMSAQAMPLSGVGVPAPVADAPHITLVAGGCGPGFHRGPYGGCRPNWRRRVYGPRCFVRRTPWSVRRVCRW
jgi:hypothetical protein